MEASSAYNIFFSKSLLSVKRSAIYFLLLLGWYGCSSPQLSTYQEHNDHSEFIPSCLNFLAGEDSYVQLKDHNTLDELKHSAEDHASNSVVIGDLYYDLAAREGRHFFLDPDDLVTYYKPKTVVIGGWEMIQHLCARHIRHEIERGFYRSGLIVRKDAASIQEAESIANENLALYLKFAEVAKGKPSHVRNFLFIPISKLVKRTEKTYFPPCNLLERLGTPILSGLQGNKRDRAAMTAWTEMMLAVTNYSITHPQECKVTVRTPLRSFHRSEESEFKDPSQISSKSRRTVSKTRYGSSRRRR
ncbi:hypothetical protein EHQ53_13070 [Leptospira langatensis]|uniref:Uncharacterized protein n=1 Tax=Leptospira langatensis TaxID=2484983 RepID=A0A5F1ZR07_9LEPT|nr:hypothetical protein [Leptospira langatensis]TGK02693.1 hypothetical protein EHO57_05040 [Leptospira langatensis]TGL40104.1 hypothetical protein EHQ53_13070 [Leptospira langatensis]